MADDGDLKRCEYEARDRPKCANFKPHHADVKLCYWQQPGFGDVCTFDVSYKIEKAQGGAKANGSKQRQVAPYTSFGV